MKHQPKATSKLFDCEDWQLVDFLHVYKNVTLKVKLGKFEPGATFPKAILDGRNLMLSFYEIDAMFTPKDKKHHFWMYLQEGDEMPNFNDGEG